MRCHHKRCIRCNECQPGYCKWHCEKSSAWSGYTTKGEDKVGAPSQGSRNEGELAGEEVVELKRPVRPTQVMWWTLMPVAKHAWPSEK